MSDQRTRSRLVVSEFQSALRAKVDAERDFTRAHDQLGRLLDDLIAENEGLRRFIFLDALGDQASEWDLKEREEREDLRRKLGLVTP